ncbi:MAG: MMPL family transporter [Lachnospiraceae bacterium]|nr:MMPL family transporter [Lachnospiraceae bacterium]
MLSRFSVKKPYTVIVGIVLVIILGVVSLSKMSTDLLPSINLPYAIVVTTYPGASPEQVESTVTQPIEGVMASTSNIKNISSISSNDTSMVVLEFEQTANMDSITVEMRESLDQISGYWPDTVGNPIIMKLNPDMMPIMIAAVEVEGMDSLEVSDYANTDLIPDIESVEGVASVSGTGLIEESVRVTLSQSKIDAVNQKITASLEEKFADAQEEMDSAESEISSGKEELDSGKTEMAGKISDAQNQLNDKKIELFQTEADMHAKLGELQEAKAATEQGISSLKELESQVGTLIESKEALEKGIAALKEQQEKVKEQAGQLQEAIKKLQEQKGLLEQGILMSPPEQLPQLQAQLAELEKQLEALKEQEGQIEGPSKQLDTQLAKLQEQLTQVEGGLAAIKSEMASQEGGGLKQDASDKELKAYIAQSQTKAGQGLVQIEGGISAIEAGLKSITEGKATINDTLATLNQSQITGSVDMGSASAQLASGEEKLKESKEAFEDTKEEAYEASDMYNILTMEALTGILTAQNFSMPAGYINDEGERYMVRVGDAVDSVGALEDMVLMDLGMDGVEAIHMSDVADIAVVDNTAESYAKLNGKPGVMLSIQKQTGYSTGDVAKRIYKKIDSMKKQDGNLAVSVLMDQGIYIDMIVDSVLNNMVFGAILAIIILLLFLKDLRPTLVIAVSIPISVIFAVVLMYFSGVTLNLISLSGLALGIGMLVDNSIVSIENIYRMRGEGLSARKAAVEGAKQVSGAITASTLTTVCVFAPIVFTEGITRQLFVDMGLTIAYSLLASLVIALTFVPMMGSKMLKKTKEVKHPLFDRLQGAYGAVLRKLLRFKILVILAMAALLAVSVKASMSKGTAFMPDMESTQMSVAITPPEDGGFEGACQLADQVTEKIQSIPDVESVGAMAGGSDIAGSMMGGSGGSNDITLYIILKEDKQLTNDEIASQITELTRGLEGEITVSSSNMDMGALAGEGLSVQVRGRDLGTLQEIAQEVSQIVSKVEGTKEVSDGLEETEKEFRITVDKEKAAKYGMTVAQVYQLVYGQMEKDTADGTISTDIKDYDVFLESVEQSDASLQSLKKLTFSYKDKETGEESEIPLSKVAEFEDADSLTSISRTGQERYITVSAQIADGYNVGLVGAKLEEALEGYGLPEGYSLEMTGEDETINEAMEQLLLMLVLAISFIYLIMVAQFQSLKAPFIILFTIPLALTGGFLALFFTGSEISIIAMIGFIMLVGIIVNNGIVMVEYINQLRKEGMAKREAIVTAGMTRLRPILMTAMTTILAMATTAFGSDMGSDMSRPMAIVTIGGMIYGTLMTLVVVPCIYDLFYSNKSMVEEEI